MKKFVVLSGGFHPFHAGHMSLYEQAKQAFPDSTILVCATNVQSERPFPFELKQKLAQLSGVPRNDFIEVSRQFSAEDPALLNRIKDLNNSVVIFVRSDKDRSEQPQGLNLNPKYDDIPLVSRGPNKGKPIKLLNYEVNKDNLQPASQHTYIAYLKTVEFGPGITSASEIRDSWPRLNDRQKLSMIYSLYPKTRGNENLANNVVNMFDEVLGNTNLSETKKHTQYSISKKNRSNELQNINISEKIRHLDKKITEMQNIIPMAAMAIASTKQKKKKKIKPIIDYFDEK